MKVETRWHVEANTKPTNQTPSCFCCVWQLFFSFCGFRAYFLLYYPRTNHGYQLQLTQKLHMRITLGESPVDMFGSLAQKIRSTRPSRPQMLRAEPITSLIVAQKSLKNHIQKVACCTSQFLMISTDAKGPKNCLPNPRSFPTSIQL